MDAMDLDPSTARPVVYVVQDSKWNILPALEFGSIETILDKNEQVFLNSKSVVEKIRRGLATYSDKDYVLPIGDPAAIGIACAVAASMNGGRFTVLKWDRQEQVYYPVLVDLNI